LPFFLFPGLLSLAVAGCSEGYSPNTYAANAAQQEATVQRGVIIGVRQVLISANGTVGAAAGGAGGGVVGAQVSGSPVTTAFGAIGGALVGGIGGTAAEQAVADAKGWEYIVQETGDKLVSITQTSKMALPVGLHVLVIADAQQARIVPDYTLQIAAASPTVTVRESATAGKKSAVTTATKTAAASNGSTTAPIHVSVLLPAADAAGPSQAASTTVASVPTVPSAPSPASAETAAIPEAASNKSSATGTPSAGPTAMSVQVAPGVSVPIAPVSSSSTAMP
jgi:outer membrane lipoprotein SlyB